MLWPCVCIHAFACIFVCTYACKHVIGMQIQNTNVHIHILYRSNGYIIHTCASCFVYGSRVPLFQQPSCERCLIHNVQDTRHGSALSNNPLALWGLVLVFISRSRGGGGGRRTKGFVPYNVRPRSTGWNHSL